jgi:FemAB-related protein (PEP-CTERM system-associated)
MTIIREALVKDWQVWNDYVNQHALSSPYHLYGWGQAVQAAYGFKPIYLIALKDGVITGVLPAIIFSIPLKGQHICSLPYCDVGSFLTDNVDITELLLKHLNDFAANNTIDHIELRQGTNCTNLDAEELIQKKVRMLLSLPTTSTELLTGFKSKLRSQINKAKKNGLTVVMGIAQNNPELLDHFYQVFTNNMRSLGSPVHSKIWINNIAKAYGEDCVISIIYHNGQAIGAGLIIKTATKASIPWASTLQKYNSFSPNMLLYWSLIEHCCDHGINEFDFGRSTYNEGTYKFKKQWGAEPVLLDWKIIKKGNSSEPLESNINNSSLRNTVETLWKKTPLWITNAIGPKIRKFISL